MRQLDMFEELKPKIYESPDNGKTVYERNFGETTRRLVTIGGSGHEPSIVKTSVQQQWNIAYRADV